MQVRHLQLLLLTRLASIEESDLADAAKKPHTYLETNTLITPASGSSEVADSEGEAQVAFTALLSLLSIGTL